MTENKWPPDNRPVIVEVIGPTHPKHPDNIARAEAARKAAEAAAAPPLEEIQKLEQIEQLAEAIDPSITGKRRKRRSRRRPASRARKNETPSERHQRLCTICNHEDREEIDQEFLDWIHPENTAEHYDIEWRAIYRHAHATGLFAARERNFRLALGHVVEQAMYIKPTVEGLLRAIRAFSSLDRDGRWTEIPTHVVVSSGALLAQSNLIPESLRSLTLRSVSPAVAVPEPAPEPPPGPSAEARGDRRLIDNESE
jgi:hypothetical protein